MKESALFFSVCMNEQEWHCDLAPNNGTLFEMPPERERQLLIEGNICASTSFSSPTSSNPKRFMILSAEYGNNFENIHTNEDVRREFSLLADDSKIHISEGPSLEEVSQLKDLLRDFFEHQHYLESVSNGILPRFEQMISIVLHAGISNAYFRKLSDNSVVIFLSGVRKVKTKACVFENRGVVFHELGHMILRHWIPNFPSRRTKDQKAIDEGISDAISLICERSNENLVLRIRSPKSIPEKVDPDDSYANGAFISAFILRPPNSVKRLCDVIAAIQKVIVNNNNLSLQSLFTELKYQYGNDRIYNDISSRLFDEMLDDEPQDQDNCSIL